MILQLAWQGFFYAPRVGFEPTTQRLTVACSAPELPRNVSLKGATNIKRL